MSKLNFGGMVGIGAVLGLAALPACTTTRSEISRNAVYVSSGMGGAVEQTLKKYQHWQDLGYQIVIDGPVVSADAFAAFGAQNACYTENAVFMPHAASFAGIVPDYRATDWLTSDLPAPLARYFRASPHYYNWITAARLDFRDLFEIWPEGACQRDALLRRDR
ncbi:hypothetical protein GCM10007939_02870 [Amylibacter marinus]|uniref:Uncharacterized protein n=1 Tax=Amylibacter marinus TaxID=1475483 RepID=A0ABQ5VS25_9RHOB|nr:hypothetical protein [Amylibacter marinus]GLQ34004.1 hypothetical protein GCM10007939_02870 [Amylibacter marinus]